MLQRFLKIVFMRYYWILLRIMLPLYCLLSMVIMLKFI
uniref:Uncharacterized protein n=1 Tax=virus sp. ctrcb4 TaxID=2825824 RepID=A0A8S5RPP2_9VIRU|nr:MAG TPA: hypothetical protein [virus sp. ctrcb4]DAR12799.1 MAG TPA: hypothetical protein [Crassvirales sp.]